MPAIFSGTTMVGPWLVLVVSMQKPHGIYWMDTLSLTWTLHARMLVWTTFLAPRRQINLVEALTATSKAMATVAFAWKWTSLRWMVIVLLKQHGTHCPTTMRLWPRWVWRSPTCLWAIKCPCRLSKRWLVQSEVQRCWGWLQSTSVFQCPELCPWNHAEQGSQKWIKSMGWLGSRRTWVPRMGRFGQIRVLHSQSARFRISAERQGSNKMFIAWWIQEHHISAVDVGVINLKWQLPIGNLSTQASWVFLTHFVIFSSVMPTDVVDEPSYCWFSHVDTYAEQNHTHTKTLSVCQFVIRD